MRDLEYKLFFQFIPMRRSREKEYKRKESVYKIPFKERKVVDKCKLHRRTPISLTGPDIYFLSWSCELSLLHCGVSFIYLDPHQKVLMMSCMFDILNL